MDRVTMDKSIILEVSRRKKIMKALDQVNRNHLKVQAPEEQSSFLVPSHCQKETLSPLGDGGGSWGGSICFASPELGITIREETSTASKSDPFTDFNSLDRISLFQRESGTPEMYQALPLSARIRPYFLKARRIT